jgi:hypothetical protein
LNDPLDEARVELEQLQKELESRRSISHFAHAGISTLAAVIFAGAAAKLFYDSVRFPILGAVAGLICFSLAAYAARHYRKGKRFLKVELERFESLKALRRTLRIDDPSVQFPE